MLMQNGTSIASTKVAHNFVLLIIANKLHTDIFPRRVKKVVKNLVSYVRLKKIAYKSSHYSNVI